MVRLERELSREVKDYIERNEATIRKGLPRHTVLQEAVQFLERLWRVLCIKVECLFCPNKVANLFLSRMARYEENKEDLSYELGLLSERQIRDIVVKPTSFSDTKLDVLQKAILQTTLLYKKELFARAAMAIEALRPGPVPVPVPIGQLTKEELHEINEDALLGAQLMLSPSDRHEITTDKDAVISAERLVANEFHQYLGVGNPAKNHVTQFAERLESLYPGKVAQLRKFLEKLTLMELLFLYEEKSTCRQVIADAFVHMYMNQLGEDPREVESVRRTFKHYLDRHKEDTVVENHYNTLLAALEQAEKAQPAQ